MIKVITTVGTSLFTNYMREEVQTFLKEKSNIDIKTSYKTLLNEIEGRARKDVEKTIESHWLYNIKQEINNDGDIFFTNGIGLNENCCAEVKTLLAIAHKNLGINLEVYLLCTDTMISELAAKIISKLVIDNITFKVIKKIEGLHVKDARRFEEVGFFNLVECVKEIKGTSINTLLNISGGYKALIPPLTLLAQLEEISLCYLYENSDELIETGNLPINFDWSVIESYTSFLQNDNQRNQKASEVEISEMRSLKLIKESSKDLTIIGRLLGDYSKQASPFTSTIFGYFIEHKLYECYSDAFGKDKVLHSVRIEGMGTEDIDLMIIPEDGQFIAIEIKPFSVLYDENKVNSIQKAFTKRINAVKEDKGIPKEVWLFLYSYTKTKNSIKTLSSSQLDLVNTLYESLKREIDENIVFSIKHLFIEENNLNQERHIYQRFMKNPIKINSISEIFNHQSK